MGRRPEWTFFKSGHTDDQQAHEKMFHFAKYQRNANQNYNQVSPHILIRMATIKKATNEYWRGCGETLLHYWQEYKLVQPL